MYVEFEEWLIDLFSFTLLYWGVWGNCCDSNRSQFGWSLCTGWTSDMSSTRSGCVRESYWTAFLRLDYIKEDFIFIVEREHLNKTKNWSWKVQYCEPYVCLTFNLLQKCNSTGNLNRWTVELQFQLYKPVYLLNTKNEHSFKIIKLILQTFSYQKNRLFYYSFTPYLPLKVS